MSNPQFSDGASTLTPPTRDTTSTSGGIVVTTGSSEVENEEQDDPSSSLHSENDGNRNIQEALTSFRTLWQKEISNDNQSRNASPKQTSSEVIDLNLEEQAKRLFLQGVKHEQEGKLYEAIQSYRKAVQLVPDIEFKLFDSARNIVKDKSTDGFNNRTDKGRKEDHISDEEDGIGGTVDLSVSLQSWIARAPALCMPALEQHGTHISSLPMEILLLIFRWVVSRDLDTRSLEMCSLVCRGFYLCSRDSEIWRLICIRIWGASCIGLSNNISSWRDMYMARPHLNFSGCYISKTTYIRHGENSFQDKFYRPWHVVEYFRYLRFFPEGKVLMMTTPDGPAPMVTHLRHRNSKYPAIIVGHYRLIDDHVTLVLRREDRDVANNRYRGRQNRPNPEHIEQTYNIELQLKPWKTKLNCQLAWTRYMVFSRRGATETVTNFDILSSKFPPFWFSRVKSFNTESEFPLM